MSKTINQALKDLYLSLGGDPSALEDNSTVSDYIADLENGLKGLAELPAPSSTNNGKIAKVVSDGEGGYIWGAENETSELPTPSADNSGKVAKVVSDGQDGYIWSAENETQELPAVTATNNGYLLGVKNGAWEKIQKSEICVNIFVAWWGDSPTITGITGDELNRLSQYVDSCFIAGGYSGAEGSPTLKCVGIGGNGAPWIFEGFIDDASGMKLIIINLVPTGTAGSMTITATKKVYTLTADT